MYLWQGVAAADPEAYLQNLCSASDVHSSSFLPYSILTTPCDRSE